MLGAVLPDDVLQALHGAEFEEPVGGACPVHVTSSFRLKSTESVSKGDLIVAPVEEPGPSIVCNLDWLSGADFWVLQVEDLVVMGHMSVSTRVVGSSGVLQGLVVGSCYHFDLPENVLTLVPWSCVYRSLLSDSSQQGSEGGQSSADSSGGQAVDSAAAGLVALAGSGNRSLMPQNISGSSMTSSSRSPSSRLPSASPALPSSNSSHRRLPGRLGSSSSDFTVQSEPSSGRLSGLGSSSDPMGQSGSSVGLSSRPLIPSSSSNRIWSPPFNSPLGNNSSGSGVSLDGNLGALGVQAAGDGFGVQVVAGSAAGPGAAIQGESLGYKKIPDLDGGFLTCRFKTNSDEIGKHLALFRLVERDRIGDFLDDLRLNVDHWNAQIFVWKRSAGDGPLGASLAKVAWTNQYLVSSDEEMFLKFLCCDYSATDWRQLTLSQFRCSHELAVQWLDGCTPAGRMVLANSLSALSCMMEVHFDPCFTSAFQEVSDFLVSPASRAVMCHDAFLKVQCDYLVAGFFGDIRRSKSVRFRSVVNFSLASPEGCLRLLRLHVTAFLDEAVRWELSPHPMFYNDDCWARRVIVDEKTFRKMAIKGNWPSSSRIYGFQPQGSAVIQHATHSPAVMESKAVLSVATTGALPICVWDVAKRLGVSTKTKALACIKGCPDSVHRKLNLVDFGSVLDLLPQVSMAKSTRELILDAVKRSKKSFRS